MSETPKITKIKLNGNVYTIDLDRSDEGVRESLVDILKVLKRAGEEGYTDVNEGLISKADKEKLDILYDSLIGASEEEESEVIDTLKEVLDFLKTMPESQDLKNLLDTINIRINDLDLAQVGANGSYIKTVKQDDGLVKATKPDFDTSVPATTAGASNINAPTTKAVRQAINYTNSNGTTVAVGGIEKGTTFDDKSIVYILEKMLYPYVALKFTSFTTNPSATTYEYGTQKTITTATPSFELGSRPLTSVKVGSTSGGNNYFNGTTATSGTAITLTNPPTIPGTADATLYMTISDYNAEEDKNTTITKSVEFKFVKYYYYTVTSNTTIPTTATAIGTGSQEDITTQNGQYIWFLSPTAKTKIQQFAMNQWNDMTTVSVGTTQFTTQTGQTLTYNVYRTAEMTAATGTYKLV